MGTHEYPWTPQYPQILA